MQDGDKRSTGTSPRSNTLMTRLSASFSRPRSSSMAALACVCSLVPGSSMSTGSVLVPQAPMRDQDVTQSLDLAKTQGRQGLHQPLEGMSCILLMLCTVLGMIIGRRRCLETEFERDPKEIFRHVVPVTCVHAPAHVGERAQSSSAIGQSPVDLRLQALPAFVQQPSRQSSMA